MISELMLLVLFPFQSIQIHWFFQDPSPVLRVGPWNPVDRHSPHVENASSDLFRIFWESCLKLRLDTSPCTSRTLHEQVCQHLCTYNQVIQVSWFCSTVLAGKCIYFVRDPFPISNFESGSPDLLRWCYSPRRWAINPPWIWGFQKMGILTLGLQFPEFLHPEHCWWFSFISPLCTQEWHSNHWREWRNRR